MVYEAYLESPHTKTILINREPESATVELLQQQALGVLEDSVLSANGCIYGSGEKIYYFEITGSDFESAAERIRNAVQQEYDSFLVELIFVLENAKSTGCFPVSIDFGPSEIELKEDCLVEDLGKVFYD